MNRLICYCFNYSEQDIIDDFKTHNGQSTILAKITVAKKGNSCQCDVKHPEKR